MERIEALRVRLPGVLIQGETEPSHSLIDKCQIMYDTGSVLWLHPSTCTKRDIEIQAALKEPSQVLKIESQSLKVSTEAQTEAADHGTELKFQWCLTRRGLAMDLTNVLSWNVHQKWVQTMFSCYSSEAPSGYGKVSLQQLIRADKEMWTIMAREVSSLKPNAQGQKPLDVMVAQLQHDPRVTMHMLALPLRAVHPADDGGHASTPLRPKKKARPGKRNRPPPSPPDELKDCYQKTVQGKPICWGYNLSSGCSGKTTGQPPTCNKGAHICAWCRKIGHSFQACRNAPSKQGNGLDNVQLKKPRLDEALNSDAARQGFTSASVTDSFSHTALRHNGAKELKAEASPPEFTSPPPIQTAKQAALNEPAVDEDRDIVSQNLVPDLKYEDAIVLEVFSGSGRLSMEVRKLGLRAVAFDKTNARTKGPTTLLNLTKESDIAFLEQYIRAERHHIVVIHLSPPCGTCSAARERALPALASMGVDPPRPLRSVQYPAGLPDLAGLDRAKVEQANLLYEATKRLVIFAHGMHIRVSIENPLSSLFWSVPCIKSMLDTIGGHDTVFDTCMMGGERDKAIKWWCSDAFFSSLNVRCSRDHDHAPWQHSFSSRWSPNPPTDEAAYPLLLCERIASLVQQSLADMGIRPPATLEQQTATRASSAVNAMTMGFLPRGQKLRPLVSEFGAYQSVAVSLQLPAINLARLLRQFPAGARVVSRKLSHWGDLRVSSSDGSRKHAVRIDASFELPPDLEHSHTVEVLSIGIPREPDDFVAAAVKAGHPRMLPYMKNEPIDDLLRRNLVGSQYELSKSRNDWLKRWLQRSRELQPDEDKLRDSMPEHVRIVLGGKRLLLLDEMLRSVHHPDVHLVKDICSGFTLSGWMVDSGCFLHFPRPPQMTLDSLLRSSAGLSRATISRIESGASDEETLKAWAETELEVNKGWLWEDLSGDLRGKVVANRFGLAQKSKVRVIDDFKLCGLNSDLTAAYKQFAICEKDRDFLRVALKSPEDGRAHVFGMNAMPFGATGSVAGFLRVSVAIFSLLSMGLHIWTSAFFDDFPTISTSDLHEAVDQQVGMFFDLLGIAYAREGKKCVPFGDQMKALGLIFDLSQFQNGVVFIRHTPERTAELLATLTSILDSDALSPKDAGSLRGRIHYYESYVFGRVANIAIHRIGKRAQQPPSYRQLDDELRASLIFLRQRVSEARPLELRPDMSDNIMVFTDGSCEGTSAKDGVVGGVLYDHEGIPLIFFSEQVPSLLLDQFLGEAENPIYLIELLAVYLAMVLWGDRFRGRFVVYYIDNEAARMALIKAYSSTKLGNCLIQLCVDLECRFEWKPWYARVPSHSNPADAPSRREFLHLLDAGATRMFVSWDSVVASVESVIHV